MVSLCASMGADFKHDYGVWRTIRLRLLYSTAEDVWSLVASQRELDRHLELWDNAAIKKKAMTKIFNTYGALAVNDVGGFFPINEKYCVGSVEGTSKSLGD